MNLLTLVLMNTLQSLVCIGLKVQPVFFVRSHKVPGHTVTGKPWLSVLCCGRELAGLTLVPVSCPNGFVYDKPCGPCKESWLDP